MTTSEDDVDPGVRIRSLLMLGNWAQQRAAIDQAVSSVPADPSEWTDTGIQSALWKVHVGNQLVELIPQVIQQSGQRPAEAVAAMIRSALGLGVEIGRRLERQESEEPR